MQTAQFGQNWGAHAQNVTVNAPAPGVSSPDDFLQVMASHNIHGVDKIAASTWPGCWASIARGWANSCVLCCQPRKRLLPAC